MKKILLALLMSLGLIANASAHHMSFDPDVGEGFPDIPPYSEMYF